MPRPRPEGWCRRGCPRRRAARTARVTVCVTRCRNGPDRRRPRCTRGRRSRPAVRRRSNEHSVAEEVPDVRDGLVRHDVAVLPVRRGDDEDVGALDAPPPAAAATESMLAGTWGSVASTSFALKRRTRCSLYERLERMSSDPALNAIPRMPTVLSDRSWPQLELAGDVERQSLVDEHRGVAELEGVVAEGGELHRVLEQAGSRGEARPGHVLRTRIILGEAGTDALEVDALRVGHHVELVHRGELDVAPRVGEELGELGLFRRQLDDRVRERRRTGRPRARSARGV